MPSRRPGRLRRTARPFREGLATALAAPTALTASLFRLRAAQLLGFEQRAEGAARLSGLLIGSELADAMRQHGPFRSVRLIGAGALGQLYEAALAGQGLDVRDGRCRAGIAARPRQGRRQDLGDSLASKGRDMTELCAAVARQPVERTSFPGRAPVSSPFSKIGVPEQIVMS